MQLLNLELERLLLAIRLGLEVSVVFLLLEESCFQRSQLLRLVLQRAVQGVGIIIVASVVGFVLVAASEQVSSRAAMESSNSWPNVFTAIGSCAASSTTAASRMAVTLTCNRPCTCRHEFNCGCCCWRCKISLCRWISLVSCAMVVFFVALSFPFGGLQSVRVFQGGKRCVRGVVDSKFWNHVTLDLHKSTLANSLPECCELLEVCGKLFGKFHHG